MKNKVSQNEVSIYFAGFKAGLLMADYVEDDVFELSPDCLEQYQYSDLKLGNLMRALLQAYKSGGFDDDGLSKMYALIKTFKLVKLSSNE